tara:strand:+ start:229 stop:1185 length:957 start_codon:yes stop_codon:yes gene_type:complete
MKRKAIIFLLVITALIFGILWRFHDFFLKAFTHPSEFFDKFYGVFRVNPPTLKNIGIGIGITLIILLIEMLILGWKKSSLFRFIQLKDKSVRNDFFYWFLGLINLYGFISFLMSFGLYYAFTYLLNSFMYLNLSQYVPNQYFLFVLYFLLVDFNFFIWHFTMHKVKLFWIAHSFHHSATSLNMLTSGRVHFISHGIHAIFKSFFVALIGMPPHIFLFMYFFKEIWGVWLHSEVKVKIGWLGRYVLSTPQWHKVHHSIQSEHHDKNFAFVFVFWDRIFKTYHKPVPVEELGIKDNPFNKKSLIHDSIYVFKKFYLSMIK